MEWIELGYFGLFVAALLAATILPFSSDLVVGAMIASELYSPIWVFVFALAGNWVGGMISYGMGRLGKWEWIEKLGGKRERIERFMGKAHQYGPYFALITWLPIIGDPMAIALGFVRSPLVPTAFWMLIGKGLRYAVIIWLVLKGVEVFV